MNTITIIGATGVVGNELIKLLDKHNNKFDDYLLLSSKRSENKEFIIKQSKYYTKELNDENIPDNSYCIFAISSELSKLYIPKFLEKNNIIIDNSSAFRMNKDVPLIVPEINFDDIKQSKLISNPNCSTIIMCMVLFPLLKLSKIKRVVVSTYQAVSGAGKEAMIELENETLNYGTNTKSEYKSFGKQCLFNCFPHNSPIDEETGYNEEELKMINETKKIFNYDIGISPECVRIPTLRCHAEALNIEFEDSLTLNDIKESLINCGLKIKLVDDIDILTGTNKEDIFVSRIRKDLSKANTYSMFIVGDQILKGASLNAIQILNKLLLK